MASSFSSKDSALHLRQALAAQAVAVQAKAPAAGPAIAAGRADHVQAAMAALPRAQSAPGRPAQPCVPGNRAVHVQAAIQAKPAARAAGAPRTIQRMEMEIEEDGEQPLRRMRGPSPERFVRVLPPGQLVTHQRPPHDFVTNEPEIVRTYVGSGLRPTGGSETSEGGLYSYFRKYGGGGYQGMVENPIVNAPVVHTHVTTVPKLKKGETEEDLWQRGRPKTKTKWSGERERAKEFKRDSSPGRDLRPAQPGRFVAMIDSGTFTTRQLTSETSRQDFFEDYSKYSKLYDSIASEHVVVTRDDIPTKSISSLGFVAEGPSLEKTTSTLKRLERKSHEAHRRLGARVRLLQGATAHPTPYLSFVVGYNLFEKAELKILAYRDGYFQVQVSSGKAEFYRHGSPTRPVDPSDAIYLPEYLFTSTVMELLS